MTADSFFDIVKNQLVNELPFVVYRKPKKSIIKAICQKDKTLFKVNDFTESGFLFSPFDNSIPSILIPNDQSEIITIDDFLFEENESVSDDIKALITDKKKHIHLVEKGISAIATGEFQKVVLSRYESVPLESNPIDIFKKLLVKYKTAFVYCWFHPKVGLWLGASPETLLTIDGNRLTTMSLAGTKPFQESLDINWAPKEIKEQQIVTDFITTSLEPFVENLNVSKLETVKAGSVLHLQSLIIANLKPLKATLEMLIDALHPTPAVCGLPKDISKQFIINNEGYNREYYTGFLGELNLKEKKIRNSNKRNIENDAYATVRTISNFYVNLRCMQIKGNKAQIYVGGGITKDSNPEAEWEETMHKSLVMKKILQ